MRLLSERIDKDHGMTLRTKTILVRFMILDSNLDENGRSAALVELSSG